ncbi:MAG: ECF-type sigma factor [Planctomycetota bacterium]
MDRSSPDETTEQLSVLIQAAGGGDRDAMGELWTTLYRQLHEIASRQMAREREGSLMQTTAVVHEAWFRLSKTEKSRWQDQPAFMAAAANVMRRVLIDHARKESAARRGGTSIPASLSDTQVGFENSQFQALAVHDALERLSEMSPEQATTLELMIFGGMSGAEVAAFVGVSESTIDRRMRSAKAWLRRELS